MTRFIVCLLALLIGMQGYSQNIRFTPLQSNPVLQSNNQDRQLDSRSDGYTEEINVFRGESVSRCADTSRLDNVFDQLLNEDCSPLEWGTIGFDGHCIQFTADAVDQDRDQMICLSVRDNQGNTFNWTLIFHIRSPRSLPFVEDFYEQDHRPDPTKWLDRDVFVNNTWAKDPISMGVASFDGIDESGRPYGGGQVYADSLTSTYINLSDYSAGQPVYLTFWIQPGGLGQGFVANVEDSLFLEFKKPDGQWKKEFSTPGASSFQVPPFRMETIRIDPLYFYEDFQFRFYNHSNLEGITDLWHLDYIKLSLDANPDQYERDISFTRVPASLLKPYTSMPWKHFTGNVEKYTRDSTSIELFGHFSETRLADSSRFSIRERKSGTLALPSETLLEVPPLVPTNQPNVSYGSHSYQNPIKDLNGLYNSLNNDFDPQAEHYTFVNSYSFTQAQEVLQEWIANNEVQRETHFRDYFAYDDGTAEGGVYLAPGQEGGLPRVAIEFTAETGDTLRGLRMLLPHIQEEDMNQEISLLVWTGDLDNEPIYLDEFVSPIYPDQYYDTLAGFTTFALESPSTGEDTSLYIPPGRFYIGWQQQNTIFNEVGMYVGFDRNSPDGTNYVYFNAGDGNWETLQEANPSLIGSIMMRPVFGNQAVQTTEVSNPGFTAEVALYPNPGHGIFQVKTPESLSPSPRYSVFTQDGKRVAKGMVEGGRIDLRWLEDGLYHILLHWTEQGLSHSSKIFISKDQ